MQNNLLLQRYYDSKADAFGSPISPIFTDDTVALVIRVSVKHVKLFLFSILLFIHLLFMFFIWKKKCIGFILALLLIFFLVFSLLRSNDVDGDGDGDILMMIVLYIVLELFGDGEYKYLVIMMCFVWKRRKLLEPFVRHPGSQDSFKLKRKTTPQMDFHSHWHHRG